MLWVDFKLLTYKVTLHGGGQNVWDISLEKYTEFLKV